MPQWLWVAIGTSVVLVNCAATVVLLAVAVEYAQRPSRASVHERYTITQKELREQPESEHVLEWVCR